MYEKYWELKEKPFEHTPDPRFIYYSQQHEEAMARIMYAVRERKGSALLTGEYGCGKTMLSRVIWNELQQENRYQAVFILDPRLSRMQLLQEILFQLNNGEIPKTKIQLFHTLNKILYTNHNAGKHTVIVIDEAQSIKTKEIFEELRLLLNFQLNNAFLLTIVLLGSSELKQSIMKLPQFVQRMAVRYHIRELNEKETGEYVKHRLSIAGAVKDIFRDDTFKEIFLASGGVPRRINTICDLSLLIGFGSSLEMVDKETVFKVREDMQFSGSERASRKTSPAEIPAVHVHDNLEAQITANNII
jgi:type II secretory pathway predicted ATPase ExeA